MELIRRQAIKWGEKNSTQLNARGYVSSLIYDIDHYCNHPIKLDTICIIIFFTITTPALSYDWILLDFQQNTVFVLQCYMGIPFFGSGIQRGNKNFLADCLPLGLHNDVNIIKIPRPDVEQLLRKIV